MDVQKKPLGIKIILVTNSIPVILVAAVCIIIIVRYNLSAYPGATAEGISRIVGSISASAFLPGIIIYSVIKRKYTPTMIGAIILLLVSCNMPLYALISIPTLMILCASTATERYLKGEEHKKEDNHNKSN